MSGGPVGDRADRRLAGFWPRLLGWAVDHLLILTFFLPALVVLVASPRGTVGCHVDLDGQVAGFGEVNARCQAPTASTWSAVGLLVLLAVIGTLLYQGLLAGGQRGQTLGMRAAGVRLVDADTGEPIGGLMAGLRYVLGATISAWLLWFGYLWNLWDRDRQTWHDKLTSAVVVEV